MAEVERRDLAEVVLVGQSRGGYPITGAAHALTGRLAKVIYYNAIVRARRPPLPAPDAPGEPPSHPAASSAKEYTDGRP